jgi:hypothetical protein
VRNFKILSGGDYNEDLDVMSRKQLENTDYNGRKYTVLVVA